jgi:1-acyl-sn-glycerol-3-phosphate acyltransferase
LASRILYWIARLIYRLLGWHVDATLLDVPKYVIIYAPHTSNWDGFLAFVGEAIVTCGFHTVKLSFLAKDSLFRWPMRPLMLWLGGTPVDRRAQHGLVDQVVRRFKEQDRLVLAITPEGMRKRSRYWKTGFYYVALGAGVPILLVFVDYKRKLVGSGPTIHPSGDIQADMLAIRAFYSHVAARHPERVGEMSVPPLKP